MLKQLSSRVPKTSFKVWPSFNFCLFPCKRSPRLRMFYQYYSMTINMTRSFIPLPYKYYQHPKAFSISLIDALQVIRLCRVEKQGTCNFLHHHHLARSISVPSSTNFLSLFKQRTALCWLVQVRHALYFSTMHDQSCSSRNSNAHCIHITHIYILQCKYLNVYYRQPYLYIAAIQLIISFYILMFHCRFACHLFHCFILLSSGV